MSIESDAQRDLALDSEDAESVVGGKGKGQKKASKVTHHPAAAPMIVEAAVGSTSNAGTTVDGPEDPDADTDC